MPKSYVGSMLNGLVTIEVTLQGGGANATATEFDVINNGQTTLTLIVFKIDGTSQTFNPPPGTSTHVLNPPLLVSEYAGIRIGGA